MSDTFHLCSHFLLLFLSPFMVFERRSHCPHFTDESGKVRFPRSHGFSVTLLNIINTSETSSLSTTAPLVHPSKSTCPAGPTGEVAGSGHTAAGVWMRLRVSDCGFLAHRATILEGSLFGRKEVELSLGELCPSLNHVEWEPPP